jgi:pilus assembly protein CpaB
MKRLETFIAIIALIVAVLVAFGVYHLVYSSPAVKQQALTCPPVPEMIEVIVANKLIHTGEPVSDSITYEKWPQSSVRTEIYNRKMISNDLLKELIARRIIEQGEPITQTNVVDRKGQGVLAALVKKGLRAVSISLDPNSNIGGLLNPGDIVDVILALNAPDKDTGETNRMLLCGVKVLALDQHYSNVIDFVAKKAAEGTQSSPKTVTLEVTPKQASALAAGMKLGTLSLSLHSSREGESLCVEGPIKQADRVKITRGDETQPQQN